MMKKVWMDGLIKMLPSVVSQDVYVTSVNVISYWLKCEP
jgi:hypothetical protein